MSEYKENQIFPIDPNLLEAHKKNTEIYGDELDMDLVDSIDEIGQLDPIVVTKTKDSNNYQIISGHRRWNAIKEIKKERNKEIEAICVFRTFIEEYQLKEALIEFNRQRKKVPVILFRESLLLDEILVDKAEFRRIINLTKKKKPFDVTNSSHRENPDEVTNSSPEEENGNEGTNSSPEEENGNEGTNSSFEEENGRTITKECEKLGVKENYLSKIKRIGRYTLHEDPEIKKIALEIMDETGKIGEPEGELSVDAALKKLEIKLSALTGRFFEDIDKEEKDIDKKRIENADELKDLCRKLINEMERGKTPNSVYPYLKDYKNGVNKCRDPKILLGNYSVIVADPSSVRKASRYILTDAKNAALFLYASHNDLKSKIELLERWDFKLEGMVFFKIGNVLNHYFNNDFLIVLLGIKNNIKNYIENIPNALISLESDTDFSNSIVYEMAEQMFPNHTYADPFQDPKREGWTHLKVEDHPDNHCLHDITRREDSKRDGI